MLRLTDPHMLSDATVSDATVVHMSNQSFKETRSSSVSASSSITQNSSMLSFVSSPDLKNSGIGIRRLLSHSLAHAAYDLCGEDWKTVASEIEKEMDLDSRESAEFARHLHFLESDRHCRFSDQYSDMSLVMLRLTDPHIAHHFGTV